MVVTELALTVVLLSGAGLMIRSFIDALRGATSAFELDGLMTHARAAAPVEVRDGRGAEALF